MNEYELSREELLQATTDFARGRGIRLRRVDPLKIDERYDSIIQRDKKPTRIEAYSGGTHLNLCVQYIGRGWGEEFAEVLQTKNQEHYFFASNSPSDNDGNLSFLIESERLKQANRELERTKVRPQFWYENELMFTSSTFEYCKNHLIATLEAVFPLI